MKLGFNSDIFFDFIGRLKIATVVRSLVLTVFSVRMSTIRVFILNSIFDFICEGVRLIGPDLNGDFLSE